MKCSYRNHLKATVWTTAGSSPPRRRLLGPKRFALVLVLLSLACGSRWTGSVGAVFGKNNADGRLFVKEAPDDMGAAKAGVHAGDEVTAIDGVLVSSFTSDEVHKALAGAVGSKVRLTVVRDGKILVFEVERGPLRGE
jgi:C-terminal processing protease CtpA/Prc